jgi:predicted phage tail protein
MLVTVRLHGPLADTYGGEHRFAVRSPREAIDALDANYPGFRRDFLKTQFYGVLADGDWREPGEGFDVATSPVARELDFAPMIEGRITGTIVAGLGLIGITGVAATILAGVITVGLLVGVSLLLAPKPKKKTSEDSKKDESYMFSGPENVTEQGVAVPLVYGRCFVGSVVVSAGLEVADQFIASSGTTMLVAPGDEDKLGFQWPPRIPVEGDPPLPLPPTRRSRPYVPGNA